MLFAKILLRILLLHLVFLAPMGAAIWQGKTAQELYAAAAPYSARKNNLGIHPIGKDFFSITSAPRPIEPFPAAAAQNLLINEVDAETPGIDNVEFVELFDGGSGLTNLDGLLILFFNGQDDRSYQTFDLTGYLTDEDGYFILGNDSVHGVDLAFADNVLQNGPDAVALYFGQPADFPNGTTVTTTGLVDAFVYGPDGFDDSGLLILLDAGEPQTDENSRDLAWLHSNQRCPNGSGGPRQTRSFKQDLPTPKSTNNCVVVSDSAPQVLSTSPAGSAVGVSTSTDITITFSEAVTTGSGWYRIDCSYSGAHNAAVSESGAVFTLNPASDFAPGENCTVTLLAEFVTDNDAQDPPDHMTEDYIWSFTVQTVPGAQIYLPLVQVSFSPTRHAKDR